MPRNGRYGEAFFASIEKSSLASAEVIVPLIFDLVGPLRSAIDVGCGTGAWLKVLSDFGVADYVGLDGWYVSPEQLLISPAHFRPADLSKGLQVDRRYDVAFCLEVVEHLSPEAGDAVVATLVELSDVIVFSAAIPYQGGTGHVNEQWPQYWGDRFAQHHYLALDPFRRRIWDHPQVDRWFAQNIVLFASGERVAADERLAKEFAINGGRLMSLVHPRFYLPRAQLAKRYVDFVHPLIRPLSVLLRRRTSSGSIS